MAVWNPEANDIFLHAVEMMATEREAYMNQTCGENAELRAQVEALLAASAKVGSFLEHPADPYATGAYHPESEEENLHILPMTEGPGTRIGPYKLMEQIGEGGFGLVFVAEQTEPVKRKVALKIIKPGMDSKQVIARFEQERQALALMDHPNIARVLDAGATATGRPYFVMELVRGIPMTEYCDQQHLTPRERLELFVTVCQAIQHAHQKGVIHRDIKPSNVLVTSHDGKPVAKVIDFGVAKAIHQHLTERTLYTQFAQMIGTPLYMSPEQAEMSGLDIDTRADIYSLGVLLYELLTGSTPLERKRVAQAAYDEMRRLIREEEPPKPSQRLSTSETLATIAACRKTEPAKLSRLLRGDLDWITMKALEKDRTRRYETANGLARDIQRYLADEAVEASPPSATYRLRKFVRRHKGPVLAASLIFLALLAGMAGTAWQAIRAEAARRDEAQQRGAAEKATEAERLAKRDAEAKRKEAERNLAFAKKGNEILGSVFAGLNPKVNYATVADLRNALRDNLNKAVKELEGTAIGNPVEVAQMQSTLGVSLLNLGEAKAAIKVLQKAWEINKTNLGPDHYDTLASMNGLAEGYRAAGQLDKALALYVETLSRMKVRLEADHPLTLTCMYSLANTYQDAGQLDKALALYVETLGGMKFSLGADHPDTLSCVNSLATCYRDAGQFDKALPLSKEVFDLTKAKVGADHPDTLIAMSNLGRGYHDAGQLDKALPLLEKAFKLQKEKLGADHPKTLTTMNNLALAYQDTGRFDEAVSLLEEALKLMKRNQGADHPDTLWFMNNLAAAYQDTGQLDKAVALYERAFTLQKDRLGADHPRTLACMNNLATAYWQAKRLDRSIPLLKEALQRQVKQLGRQHPHTLQTVANLGTSYKDAGRLGEAIPLLEEGYRASKKYPMIRWVGPTLLDGYVKAGKATEAAKLIAELLADLRQKLPKESPQLAGELAQISLSLLQVKAFAEAEPLLRECLAIRAKTHPDFWTTFNTKSQLGGALVGQKKYVEAEPLLLQGYEGMKQRADKIPEQFRKVRLTEALERLVQLYDATSKKDEAAKWRQELERNTKVRKAAGMP